ncbi:MAG: type I DNA topoisomerase [Bacteroidetes bacterium]|nr:type I DNA topoisomerase [Bacteroidota bacterium]
MSKNLVIVESPAKARTIEKFLGDDFTVKSSVGHIRDLPKKNMGVDIKKDFEPVYEISPDKKQVVAELRQLAKKATTIWLATDEDREGEAIAWHLCGALGLSVKKTKRVVYHEITKTAIQEALANPRTIDENLVNAQQARRILDRLVGYELSPILWKKVKPSLSAGRVQSVSVKLLVEREREINEFEIASYYKVLGIFSVKDENGKVTLFKGEHPSKLKSEQEAKALLDKINGANFSVKNIEKKPSRRTPAAPFTTSTLQQEASRKLGYSVSQTMRLAQGLYEAGKITYMRTDSVTLSGFALNAAKNEINRQYGDNYWKKREYHTKSANAQEAHEAIRPTFFSNRNAEVDDDQQRKLYDLIWKRAIASQMADAELEKTVITLRQNMSEDEFFATGEIILFDGFLKVYMEGTDDEEENEEGILPGVTAGQEIGIEEISATERFTQPPARYTEASLVKKLESLGIGRPSTYAPTISTIVKRNYVAKEIRDGRTRSYKKLLLKGGKVSHEMLTEITGAEKGKLYPTDIGMVVNDFLERYFPQIMDYKFTAYVEEEFDEIAEGKLSWKKMLAEFYEPFHKTVVEAEGSSERQSGEKILGTDPKSGRQVLVRVGRFGPMAQIGHQDDKEKPKYASLRKAQSIETITLESALDLFKLPRTLGKHENEDIVVSIGRFGPYIKYKTEFISLPKTEDPYTISLERVIEILTGPRLPRTLGQYEGQSVIAAKGFFGNYLKHGSTNASLPKRFDPFLITLEEAIEILKVKIQKDKEKHIKSWAEDRRVKVVIGRWGPCIQSGKKFFKIPAGKEPLELELEECLVIAGIKKAKKGKTESKSKVPSQKPKVEKVKPQATSRKLTVSSKHLIVKKTLPKKPKLRIVKAKRKFAGKRHR